MPDVGEKIDRKGKMETYLAAAVGRKTELPQLHSATPTTRIARSTRAIRSLQSSTLLALYVRLSACRGV